jgi:hypothetical protein
LPASRQPHFPETPILGLAFLVFRQEKAESNDACPVSHPTCIVSDALECGGFDTALIIRRL